MDAMQIGSVGMQEALKASSTAMSFCFLVYLMMQQLHSSYSIKLKITV
jgi:hypothetical protein